MSFLFSGGLFSVFVWLIVALICQAIRASPIPRYCSKEETVKRMRGQVEIEKEFAQRLAERNARIATSKNMRAARSFLFLAIIIASAGWHFLQPHGHHAWLAQPHETAIEQPQAADLPDPNLTPGDVFSDVTVADISKPGYARRVRNVTAELKAQVYAEYGITNHAEYVIDHLCPIELGGSNSAKNLWPQKVADAHWKDVLEDRLRELVISGRLDLRTAQQAIASDWIAAYQKYVEAPKPSP